MIRDDLPVNCYPTEDAGRVGHGCYVHASRDITHCGLAAERTDNRVADDARPLAVNVAPQLSVKYRKSSWQNRPSQAEFLERTAGIRAGT